MAEIVRLGPEEVRPRVDAGKALLVCAYEDDSQFRNMRLSGAIAFSEFQSRLSSLPKSKEIVFYCG